MKNVRFPSDQLIAKNGEIYAHVFENINVGIVRNLFWSITIDFKPVVYAGKKWSCSMTCEWIPWAIKDWRKLHGKHLDVAYGENNIESSFYMGEHNIGLRTQLWLVRTTNNVFSTKIEMTVDFKGYSGRDEVPTMKVAAIADIPFTGILVVPDNLEPKPTNMDEIKNAASQFVELSCYYDPKQQNHAYIFKPKY
jgi:hypothetical protein